MTEPLRIGGLGTARINDLTLFPLANDIGARIVTIAARDRARAEEYARDRGIERVVDDYDAVIADPEVEAIYNPLPNGLHTKWSLRAITAVNHVLSEKPFASNTAEAQLVHEAAQARPELVVFDGLHDRYHPVFLRLLELVRDGAVGDIQHVRAIMSAPVPDLNDTAGPGTSPVVPSWTRGAMQSMRSARSPKRSGATRRSWARKPVTSRAQIAASTSGRY